MNICGSLLVLLTISNGFICTPLIPGADDLIIDEFSREIQRWAVTKAQSMRLTQFLNDFAIPKDWQRLNWAKFTGDRANTMCKICKSTAKAFLEMKPTTPAATIKETFIKLCTKLNFQPERVCAGITDFNFPILYYIAENDLTIDENDFCGLILQDQGCDELPKRYNWTIVIDDNSSMSIDPRASDETIKILQITDIHYDPLYEANGAASCDEPTCCRKGQNSTGDNEVLAGFWGDYNNCDTPWHAVLDALDEMKTRHGDADLIYFTGDMIDHGVWETSREKNRKSLLKIFRKMKETFGDQPIYPIIGNHESQPLNQFAPNDVDESLSTTWLYKLMADIWIGAGWLPESARETILIGGYYTISPRRGLRLIAMNNNMAYIYNWWLIYKPVDPSGQLQWLADTLLSAEKNNEIVHILGHMPNGSPEVQHTWSQEYRKIIQRFSHIIAAQFNGHTHNDEFNVFYHPEDNETIINIAWNGGSVTTFTELNPNYRIYSVNAESYAVEDADTWIFNITEANLTPNKRPRWYKLYNFKDEYNLKNLSKEILHDFIVDMRRGGERLNKYHRNFHKYADPALKKECNDDCLQEHVCTIVKSSSNDKGTCQKIRKN